MQTPRRNPVLGGRLVVGGPTAVAILLLIVAGAVLFVLNKERPRDFTGYPFLAVPFVGTALLTRGDLGAGFTAAVLSCVLGYIVGIAVTVLQVLAAIT